MADANKTEQATPQRRKKARESGQVTRSREVTSALTMAAVAGTLVLLGKQAVPQWTHFYKTSLDLAATESFQPGGPILFWTCIEAFRWIVPMLLAALAVSLIAGFAQGGFVFSTESLTFKFDRLNPAERMSQLFSLAGLSNILKSLLPFTAIGWVGVDVVRSHWNEIISSAYVEPRQFATMMGTMLLQIGWKSGLVLLGWAAVDYMLMWRKNENDLKMSRQDIRDELKQSEGNPENKARIRRLQRHNRRKRMLKAAETATVVITNPTHYAVALRYEVNMAAPVVVAKGLDLLAQKIKEIAWKHDIPVMENRPLAQALYKSVEVGDPIPAALYHAVAEILVLIYRAQAEVRNREAKRRAAMRTTQLNVRPL